MFVHHVKRHVGVHHINSIEKFILAAAIITAGAFGIMYGVKAYPEFFKTEINAGNLEEILPADSVAIDFSMPVFTDYYENKIKIEPAEEFMLRWGRSNGRLSIVPKNFWKPGTDYKIILPEGKNIMFSKIPGETIVFSTQRYPEVLSVTPRDGSENAEIDMEEPIEVNFKEPVVDFSIKFTLSPGDELSVQSNAAQNQYKLLPKNGTDYATQYSLKAYAKYKEDIEDNYKQIFESSFTTALPPQIVWDKDYKLRLEQARKYTPAKIKIGKYIDINLSAQIMSIFEDGKMLDDFMVSSGKKGMDTPKGETQIYNKFPRAYSPAYGLYMPNWMALTPSGKFGIHELPEWPNGYKEGTAHLGVPVSHGCVRLGVGPAEKVYNWAEIGTPVAVY